MRGTRRVRVARKTAHLIQLPISVLAHVVAAFGWSTRVEHGHRWATHAAVIANRCRKTARSAVTTATTVRATSASRALGVLNDYAPYKSTHSLTRSQFSLRSFEKSHRISLADVIRLPTMHLKLGFGWMRRETACRHNCTFSGPSVRWRRISTSGYSILSILNSILPSLHITTER